MEKGANRPWASRERKRSTRDLHPASTSRRPSFFNRLLRASLAVILAAGLLPLLPVAPVVEEAEALSGTSNYANMFTIANRRGTPGSISGNTLRAAGLITAADSIKLSESSYGSSAFFISKRAVPLNMSWRVRASVNFRNFGLVPGATMTGANMMFGFSRTSASSSLQGVLLALNVNARSTGLEASVCQRTMTNSAGADVSGTRKNISYSSRYNVVFGYDVQNDKLTMSGAGPDREYPNVKSSLGGLSSAYMVLMGTLAAEFATSKSKPLTNKEVSIDFDGVELPNLNPAIREVKLYDESGKLLGPNDVVNSGDKVRVVCRVYNNSGSRGEAYPTTLKLVGGMTSGFTPFADSNHQTRVMTGTGAVVSASSQKMDGATGVSFTLSGTDNVGDRTTDTVVEYWGAISGSAGSAVTVGHQATENTFGLSSSAVKTTLLNERPLKPGDGSGSGAAGHDYHYTRLPAPNANGWNTSPVTVTFYPGDFDQMTLTPSEGAAKVLTGDDPAWMRSDDTAGVSLSAQAKDTESGAVSTQRAGLVKIDTSAPRIEGGGALGYTLTDVPADASKATSGIWRLHRTDSSGAVAAGARSGVYRPFDLTNGDGAPTQAVGNLPNGYYRAEDAAGNLSAPLKVSSTEPPAVERPAGSLAGPGDPGYAPPVGPPIGPGDDVPDPAVTEDAGGLRHAVIEESVSQMIDPSAPPFGGLLEPAEATAMMDYRYASASAAAPTTQADELLDASGNPIASFDTKVPGECTVKRVITDAQGNTTTILLRYRTVRDSCPPVRPLEPSDPADPDGPRVPGDPLAPTGSVTTNPDGTQHVEVACDVTEAVTHGTMDTAGAEALFKRHFAATDVDGGDGVTLTVQSMKNSSGGYLLH